MAAKRRRNLAAVHAPFSRPVDIDLKFYWEHKVPILTLANQMVAERGTFDSTIEANRNNEKGGSSLGRFLSNALYQLRYSYGRFSHPLKPAEIAGLGSPSGQPKWGSGQIMKKNLVVVRAGGNPLHPAGKRFPYEDRNYDLLISFFLG